MIIGHRGFKDPLENTLESILYALDNNFDGIEIDIRKCKTGELVVFHDETLERLTNFRNFQKISELTLSEISNINLFDKFGNKYKILILENLLRNPKIIRSEILINLEVKEPGVCEPLIKLLKTLFEENLYLPYRFLISSFIIKCLSNFTKFQKSIFVANSHKINVLDNELKEKWFLGIRAILPGKDVIKYNHFDDLLNMKEINSVILDKSLLIKELLIALKKGYKVFVYTIEKESELKYKDMLDGIITDIKLIKCLR